MNLAALAYLTAPGLLFLVCFVKPVLGLPLAAVLFAVVGHVAWHRRCRAAAHQRPRLESRTLFSLVLALVVLSLMGFAGGEYCWDWIKHWALLNTLESQPWPVELNLRGEPGYMRFYIGAYLVPAGLAYVTGWSVAACTALWYGLGLVLAFRLLSDGSGHPPRLLWVIPLLLCMAGADAWLQSLLRPEGRGITFSGFHHEWWANSLLDHPLQYGSMLCLLLWVPHQAIPAFIVVGVLRRLKTAEDLGPTALATGMLALWSPYALIGVVLFAVPHVLAQPTFRQVLRRPGLVTSGALLAACMFAALMAWTLAHELPAGGICLNCVPARLLQPSPYLLFVMVELAIPLLLLRRKIFDDAASIAAVATLVVLPWIGGPVPDAVMRISMPALIYLFVRCAHDMVQRPPRQFVAAAVIVLAIGGPTVWGEISFQVEGGARHRALPASDPLAAPYYTVWAQRTDYTAQQFFEVCGWKWYSQYFATTPPPTWPHPVSAPAR